MSGGYDELVHVVEIWQTQRTAVFERQSYNEGSNARSLREFVGIQNRLASRLVSLLGMRREYFADLVVCDVFVRHLSHTCDGDVNSKRYPRSDISPAQAGSFQGS